MNTESLVSVVVGNGHSDATGIDANHVVGLRSSSSRARVHGGRGRSSERFSEQAGDCSIIRRQAGTMSARVDCANGLIVRVVQ